MRGYHPSCSGMRPCPQHSHCVTQQRKISPTMLRSHSTRSSCSLHWPVPSYRVSPARSPSSLNSLHHASSRSTSLQPQLWIRRRPSPPLPWTWTSCPACQRTTSRVERRRRLRTGAGYRCPCTSPTRAAAPPVSGSSPPTAAPASSPWSSPRSPGPATGRSRRRPSLLPLLTPPPPWARTTPARSSSGSTRRRGAPAGTPAPSPRRRSQPASSRGRTRRPSLSGPTSSRGGTTRSAIAPASSSCP
mmetsp:Transcript_7178/g.15593  ORF Transcript_7178/g.15593 Transcript_7178/m.15593 type:complete len:245 (-) Transcript_7178:434-1168(-)